MDEPTIYRFLESCGVASATRSGDWVVCSCPLSPWRHESGHDSRPSFGISITPDGPSVYNCFTCSDTPRTLPSLIQALWLNSGDYPRDAVLVLLGAEIADGDFSPLVVSERSLSLGVSSVEPIPASVLDAVPSLPDVPVSHAFTVIDFLGDRGVSLSVADAYGLKYLPHKRCLVFPYTTLSGQVIALRARSVTQKRFFMITPSMLGFDGVFSSAPASGTWFGMSRLDLSRPVILCEGELDVLRLASLGFDNAVASGGTSISHKQFRALPARRILLGFDSDTAGKSVARKAAAYMRDKAVLYFLDWGAIDCKDPGDIPSRRAALTVFSSMMEV